MATVSPPTPPAAPPPPSPPTGGAAPVHYPPPPPGSVPQRPVYVPPPPAYPTPAAPTGYAPATATPTTTSTPWTQGSAVAATHMVLAVVSLFFCLPTGAVAVYFANQVSVRARMGDIPGSFAASGKARAWGIASIVLGVVIGFLAIAARMSETSTY